MGQGRRDGIYRETFRAEERRALRLARAAGGAPLEPEAELLRVLIMRALRRERPDDEQVGRMVDRLVRVVRAQRIGARADGRDPRVDEMIGWLTEIAQEKIGPGRPAELPEAAR